MVLVLLVALVSGCASFRAARLYGSGTDALDRGDPGRAIAELEQAAALAPQASEIQNHLGLAYGAEGREAEARDAFERALELDCDNHAARENLLVLRSRTHP
ncbi:MAG: tetratricopeptide repeat protein [Proteobacteria bacterium]|nr:tetratricopeptide repeat protein [Pseudomonadota bacterium]